MWLREGREGKGREGKGKEGEREGREGYERGVGNL